MPAQKQPGIIPVGDFYGKSQSLLGNIEKLPFKFTFAFITKGSSKILLVGRTTG